jgi:hypothetical protein
VVRYQLDESTFVQFEIDPPAGFQPAGATAVIARVQDAVAPAIETARVVLDKVKETAPDEIEVKFGIKVSGKADWFIAKASTEANFEIKLTWRPSGAEEEEQEEPDEAQ